MDKSILVIIFLFSSLGAGIRFGSQNSSITFLNDSKLDLAKTLTSKGTITKADSSEFIGEKIYFDRGVFETDRSSVVITGSYTPDSSGTGTVRLHGTVGYPNVFRAAPGMAIDLLEVAGNQNRLEGTPLFNGPIKLLDEDTTLTIAIKSVLNNNIEMNGSTIVLEDDLVLADGINFVGTGTIELNDRRLSFGSEDLSMTASIYWKGAADLYLNGKIDLSASWTFEGGSYFNGDSTKLFVQPGGDITIRDDSFLVIKQIIIDGLGMSEPGGRIYFEDDDDPSSSRLIIRRGALGLTSTYTMDKGHVVVEVGSGYVVTRNNRLVFEEDSRLTVDNVNLLYKTRTYPNNSNIQPTTYGGSSNIQINGSGDIVHYRSFYTAQSLISSYNNGQLDGNVYLGQGDINKREIVAGSEIIDGGGWYYHFARSLDDLLVVNPGVNGVLTNIVLKDFKPNHLQLQDVDSSRLTFKDNVTIELGEDISFDNLQTWTFQGDCKIDGKGKIVSLGDGRIFVEDIGGEPSTLIMQDMILDGLKDGAIKIDTNKSKIIFNNVKIVLSEDFAFSKGYFEIFGDVDIYSGLNNNQVKFIYDTDCTTSSSIRTCSKLHFDRDVTFSYNPGNIHNALIDFENKTSILSLNGATLFATHTGMLLTKGTLLVDHVCTISSEGRNFDEAVIFGDGVDSSNNIFIDVMPGGNVDANYGFFDYRNIDA